MIKLIAFDLDGTLTQHKTPLEPANYETLVALFCAFTQDLQKLLKF